MRLSLLLLTAISAVLASAQPPGAQWLRTAGGFGQYYRYLSAAVPTAHIWTVGRGEEMDYGNGISLATIGTSIARYDTSGTISWARPLATVAGAPAGVQGIATNGDGDLWVCGSFSGPTLTLDTIVLHNVDYSSAFLARFDSTGAVVFAIAWGGYGEGTASADVCTDPLGQVRVTGSTYDASFTVGAITLVNPSEDSQLYVLAFDADGTVQWGTISSGSPSNDATGNCISADAAGNTYVAGITSDWLILGDDSLDAGIITRKAVLIKLDPAGGTERMDLVAACQPTDIAVDDAGNAYICGFVDNTAVFGNDTLVPSVSDGFVAAYDTAGNYRWVVGVEGDAGIDICWSVDLDVARTSLAVGGTFTASASFGGMLVETGLTSTDGFVMRLDTAGTVDWVIDMAGDGSTFVAEAHLDPWDHPYASGATLSALSFLGEPVLNGSSPHAFLARFGDFDTSVLEDARPGGELYPNPCEGAFTVALPADARTVIITDAQGREQERRAVRGASTAAFDIDVPGVYAVSVLTEAGRELRRLVVE